MEEEKRIWTGTGTYHFLIYNESDEVVHEETILFTRYTQYTQWIFLTVMPCMKNNNWYARVEGLRID